MILRLKTESKRSDKRGVEQPKDVSFVLNDHLSLAVQDERFVNKFQGVKIAFEFISGEVDKTEPS